MILKEKEKGSNSIHRNQLWNPNAGRRNISDCWQANLIFHSVSIMLCEGKRQDFGGKLIWTQVISPNSPITTPNRQWNQRKERIKWFLHPRFVKVYTAWLSGKYLQSCALFSKLYADVRCLLPESRGPISPAKMKLIVFCSLSCASLTIGVAKWTIPVFIYNLAHSDNNIVLTHTHCNKRSIFIDAYTFINRHGEVSWISERQVLPIRS